MTKILTLTVFIATFFALAFLTTIFGEFNLDFGKGKYFPNNLCKFTEEGKKKYRSNDAKWRLRRTLIGYIKQNKTKEFKKIVPKYVDVNCIVSLRGSNFLHEAIYNMAGGIFYYLLRQDIDVNQCCEDRGTPLFGAENLSNAFARELREKGAIHRYSFEC